MGKATLAKQRAIGLINQARTDRLYEAGLIVLFAIDHERLKEKVAELERRNRLLRDLALGTAEQKDVAARILSAAMNGGPA